MPCRRTSSALCGGCFLAFVTLCSYHNFVDCLSASGSVLSWAQSSVLLLVELLPGFLPCSLQPERHEGCHHPSLFPYLLPVRCMGGSGAKVQGCCAC